MLAQIELILEQLAANGGGWGAAAVFALVAWRVWKEVKPSLKTWLVLRHRETVAAERNTAAREEGNAAMRDQAASTKALTVAIDNLGTNVTDVMGNGFKKITDKLAPNGKSS